MELVRLGLYFTGVWTAGAALSYAKSSPIVGEIVVGSLLGPPLADFAPQPDGLVLAGVLGVQLAVVEAGLSTDRQSLQEIALRAMCIAVIGIIVPIGLAILFVNVAFGYSILQSFAVGAAIAPTSMGVTSRLLMERNEHNTELGRLVSAAAVFDDVLSLILLSELQVLARGDSTPWELSSPIVYAIIFIVGAFGLSILVGTLLPNALGYIPQHFVGRVEQMLLYLLVILLTYLADLARTSFLLGGYLAGISFSSRLSVVESFEAQAKRITRWLFRLFFSATIAFSIPLKALFRADALGLGACLAAAAVVGKLFCGFLAPDLRQDGLVLAVAMLGRGEFGFLIAAEGFQAGLLPETLYASTVWGVFVPTLIAPLLFPLAFSLRVRYQNRVCAGPDSEMEPQTQSSEAASSSIIDQDKSQ